MPIEDAAPPPRRPAVVPGYAKGRAKRRQILDEAMNLFGEVGYRSASLRVLAQRCGITHPTLLHYFAGKEELLLAVLEHRDEVDGARFDIPRRHGVDLLERLVDLVEANAARPGIVELYCVLSAEATASDHPAHGFFTRRYERVVALVRRAFEEAAAAERPTAEPDRGIVSGSGMDAAGAARRFVALMDGLQIQWLLDPDGVDMPAILRAELRQMLPAA